MAITSTASFGDADLDDLTGLKNLQVLALHGTSITDQGLEKLKTLPNLKRVSLGQTKVTAAGIENLKKTFPRLSWSR